MKFKIMTFVHSKRGSSWCFGGKYEPFKQVMELCLGGFSILTSIADFKAELTSTMDLANPSPPCMAMFGCPLENNPNTYPVQKRWKPQQGSLDHKTTCFKVTHYSSIPIQAAHISLQGTWPSTMRRRCYINLCVFQSISKQIQHTCGRRVASTDFYDL